MDFRLLLQAFQHCCFCGAPYPWEPSHLCGICRNDLLKFHQSKGGQHYGQDWRGFPLVSLGSYREPKLARWIQCLKGGDSKGDFEQIAKELIKRRQIMGWEEFNKFATLVPAPSRSSSSRKPNDHAYCLAEALSQLSGWPLQNILQFQEFEGEAQKTKKAQQRRERQFMRREGIFKPQGTLIFVDDVVTTGSTAQAAWQALGRPSQFEVWCIAYQPKLAGQSQV